MDFFDEEEEQEGEEDLKEGRNNEENPAKQELSSKGSKDKSENICWGESIVFFFFR